MKKVKSQGKLSLNKETVARLNDAQLNEVKGGGTVIIENTAICNYIPITYTITRPPCTLSQGCPTISKVTIIEHGTIQH
jgi:hypothetical protein